ncbi:unknown [Clostridium sp. CAG:448]|nr:unknown [Clostridium sp. CAG:448]
MVHHTDSMIAYVRRKGGEQVLVCANMGGKAVSLPLEENDWCDLLQETDVTGTLCVDPVSVRVIGTRQKKKTDGGEKHGL